MKVYIASPFFNGEQIAEVEKIKQILTKLNISFFSPKDHNLCEITASIEEQKKVFIKNVFEVINADLVIANTSNKDMGTIFEAGCAYAKKTPIIYFNSNLTSQFNLMLAQSGICVCTTFEDLEYCIIEFAKDKNFKRPYKSFIE